MPISSKVVSLETLSQRCAEAREQGEIVVLCHGVFDVLHVGHLRHLETARRHGTKLVVTITADRFVNKGPGRPIFNSDLRCEMLSSDRRRIVTTIIPPFVQALGRTVTAAPFD